MTKFLILSDISSSDGEHSVLLFTMQGWALSADPMIMKCLHYKELVASTSHPLHALRSEGASTQLSTSTTGKNSICVLLKLYNMLPATAVEIFNLYSH